MVIWTERKMNNSILKNDLLRNYPERDAKNFTVLVVNCSITAVMILISITGNSLIVLTILKNHSLHSPSMILIFGLALSDLLLGLVAQPLYIAKELSDNFHFRVHVTFFLYNCCGVSLWKMTAISLDRLAALHLHMKYTSLVTSTRVTQVLGTIWIVIHLSFGIYFGMNVRTFSLQAVSCWSVWRWHLSPTPAFFKLFIDIRDKFTTSTNQCKELAPPLF